MKNNVGCSGRKKRVDRLKEKSKYNSKIILKTQYFFQQLKSKKFNILKKLLENKFKKLIKNVKIN